MSDDDRWWIVGMLVLWGTWYGLLSWWLMRGMERLSQKINRLRGQQETLMGQHEQILAAYHRLLLHHEQEWMS